MNKTETASDIGYELKKNETASETGRGNKRRAYFMCVGVYVWVCVCVCLCVCVLVLVLVLVFVVVFHAVFNPLIKFRAVYVEERRA